MWNYFIYETGRTKKGKNLKYYVGRPMLATNVSCCTTVQQALRYTASHITFVKLQTQLLAIPHKIVKASYPAYHYERKEHVV